MQSQQHTKTPVMYVVTRQYPQIVAPGNNRTEPYYQNGEIPKAFISFDAAVECSKKMEQEFKEKYNNFYLHEIDRNRPSRWVVIPVFDGEEFDLCGTITNSQDMIW